MLNSEQFNKIKNQLAEFLSVLSADMLGWLAILLLHVSTVPGMLAVMSGLSTQMPPVDLVLMIWAALMLFFIKAAVQKNILNMVTIGIGFFGQAVMVALIFFK